MNERTMNLEICLKNLLNAHTVVYGTEEEQNEKIAAATVAAIQILGLEKKFSSTRTQVLCA